MLKGGGILSTNKKAKCIKTYFDKDKDEYIKVGDVLEVDEKRLGHLVYRGVAEAVPEEKKETQDKTVAKK